MTREKAYQYYIANAPEVDNPHLDRGLPNAEQLVYCPCGKKYRVFANGKSPIPDMIMPDVLCPNCGAPASDFLLLSGHSAGVFNASIFRTFAKTENP